MKVVILVLVVIAALFAIGSGVWVATALVRAISRRRTEHTTCHQPEDKSNGQDV